MKKYWLHFCRDPEHHWLRETADGQASAKCPICGDFSSMVKVVEVRT